MLLPFFRFFLHGLGFSNEIVVKFTSHEQTEATGKTRMIKADRGLLQRFFLAKDLGKPLNCLRLFGTQSLPCHWLSLADIAGVQLHHTQKSYLRNEH